MIWLDQNLCTYEVKPWKCHLKQFLAVLAISIIMILAIYGNSACWWHRIAGW